MPATIVDRYGRRLERDANAPSTPPSTIAHLLSRPAGPTTLELSAEEQEIFEAPSHERRNT
jgi:hypothetical protein